MSDERFDLEKVPQVDDPLVLRTADSRAGGYPDGYGYGYGYGYPEDDEKVYLRRMWRAVKKRKWILVVITVITTTVVTLEVFRTKSVYKASTTIEIGKEGTTLVKTGDLILTDDSDDYYSASVGMKTKIRLLQSRPLLEEVVARLKLEQNPKFLDVSSRKSVWEALTTVASKFRANGAPAEAAPQALLASDAIDIPRTREERERLTPFVDVLSKNLTAEPLDETRMLQVSFTHTDPALAADIVDSIAKVFIQRNFETKTEKFTNTSEWLEQKTRELKAKVEQAEQSLADYTRQHNLFSTDGKETLSIDKLSRLHEQATRAEADRILKDGLYQEVKAGRVAQLPDAFSDAKIIELKKRLGELAVELAQLDVKFGPKHQKIIEIKQQIAAIEDQIAASQSGLEEKLQADYQRAVRDETALKAALERAKSEAAQQNQAAIQLNMLQQEVDTAKSFYTEFLQKTNQARIQQAEQHNNIRLVEPAQVPVAPVGPNRMRTIAIGFALSMLAGLGLVFCLEYLDNSIKTVEDISRYAQLPALSVIPAISARKSRSLAGPKRLKLIGEGQPAPEFDTDLNRLATLDSRSSVAEAYRVLRTSVLLSTAGNPPRRILITSGQPGEGKTTTTVNTAISLAQLGASVLIIDADLRKPSAHKVLGINHSRGLSTYLSRDTEIDELIQKAPIANLSVLPCGPIPPNPAELISSPRMRELLDRLSERYDHILIDSPPLLKVTDPVILSTLVDGVILVVHGGKSTREIVRRARIELANVGAKVFGVVLNNVDVRDREYGDGDYYGSYSDYGQDNTNTMGAST